MTRVLSDLLGAREPLFQQSLRQLESLAGHPKADIRLSSSIQQSMRAKLHELRLDSSDTTGPELYAAVGQRLHVDELRFHQTVLKTDTADTAAVDGADAAPHVARLLSSVITPHTTYALKPSAAKQLLRQNLPRKAMKALGYRSVESMLKHESAAALYAAGWLVESNQWAKRLLNSYAKLGAKDFEQRDIVIEHPTSRRWHQLSSSPVAARSHHVLSFKELGSVVLLPLPTPKPALSTLTTAVLALHAVNEIRAAGTFIKLHQMQSGFGTVVQQVVHGEPMLPSLALDEPVSWHSLHQYFARFNRTVQADIFEPMLAIHELAWTSIEQTLVKIEPSLAFWHDSAHIGQLSDGRPVSCNLTDSLLNYGGNLPYEQRGVQYFRQSLRSELLLHYLAHDKLGSTMIKNVQTKLVPELAFA